MYYKTKLVKPAHVDFAEAFAFNADDRARQEAELASGEKPKRKCDPVQSAKNLILG